jgi:hypothetical protein
VDPVRAETYLRLLAESELRQPAPSSRRDRRAERIWLAGVTLTAAGAIDPEAAQRVLQDFEVAAALRPGDAVAGSGVEYLPRLWPRSQPMRPGSQPPPRATGPGIPLRAVPVGATLSLPPEQEGRRGEFRLMALVSADSHAVLTGAARWADHQPGRPPAARPSHAPYDQMRAVDDQGNPYDTVLWDGDTEGGREWRDCHLLLSATPPAESRWLEIGPGADGAYQRIDLSARPTPAEVTTDPVPPASAAARLLDEAAEALLIAGRNAAMTGVSQRVAEVVRALTQAGAVSAGEPALARLAVLAAALRLNVGTLDAGDAPMPEAWASIIAERGASDGPEAIAPFAVTLPELDGAGIALAGLRSSRHRATLHVLARGWVPGNGGWLAPGVSPGAPPGNPSLSWRARDSAGRWHIAEEMSRGDGGMIQMYLTPPLHPAATSLDVILTGASRRVRATVPLNWQA